MKTDRKCNEDIYTCSVWLTSITDKIRKPDFDGTATYSEEKTSKELSMLKCMDRKI